ncbi:hypothetical protein niasHT_023687 [Heterodera trifolii]|uniref:Uncharacterized protein n=1 Tax=Heterodera trifolii TaxID=157864 RepID=A0ABD2JA02_9BILA
MEIVNMGGESIANSANSNATQSHRVRAHHHHFHRPNCDAFLELLRPLFASFYPINLAFGTDQISILDLVVRNTWPMLGKNIYGIESYPRFFKSLRKFVPSILNDCPSLRFVSFSFGDLFPEFPCDDSATASDGQALAKWLFTPLQSNVPKVFKCNLVRNEWENWPLKIDVFKAAFANASSPVNFIVSIWFLLPFASSVVPFDLTNELTREQLTLKGINNSQRFLLIRYPIARDASKWTKWEKEAIDWKFFDQWNRFDIHIINEDNIGDGLFDETPGPSDQQQK